MNILLVDVAATESGALSILNHYYNLLQKDCENTYFFCVSTPTFLETSTVFILNFPWVKKSWLHRLWFDNVVAPKLIKKHNIDEVFSLQNIGVRSGKIASTIYLHQSLPYSSYRYRFTENPKFWIYQNIISIFINTSLKKATKIITQTEWMKKAICDRNNLDPKKVFVEYPQISLPDTDTSHIKRDYRTFFYPALAFSYKNHNIIFKAAKRLKETITHDFTIFLTINEKDIPKESLEIYSELKQQIILIGFIPREETVFYYKQSSLLFPSYIESYPLPLIEAKLMDAPIITSDFPFSHEILDDYDDVFFVDAFNEIEIVEKMTEISTRHNHNIQKGDFYE